MMKVNGSVVLIELHQPQHRPPFNRFGSLADKPRCPDHVRFATTENVGRVESALCWYPQSGYARQTTRSALACGAGDTYSLADVAVTPYVNRAAMLKMEGLWSKRPGVEAWLARMRERTSFERAIDQFVTDHERNIFDIPAGEMWLKAVAILEED